MFPSDTNGAVGNLRRELINCLCKGQQSEHALALLEATLKAATGLLSDIRKEQKAQAKALKDKAKAKEAAVEAQAALDEAEATRVAAEAGEHADGLDTGLPEVI
jgi:membrane protein involved in colicin uptake